MDDEPTKEYPKYAPDTAGRHEHHVDYVRGLGKVGWFIGAVVVAWLVFVAYELGHMYKLWGH